MKLVQSPAVTAGFALFLAPARALRKRVLRILGLACIVMLALPAPSQAGLKIILSPGGGTGGTPPANLAGGGNLMAIVQQAAAYWEQIYSDPQQEWTVQLEYRWGLDQVSVDNLSGQFTLFTAGGNPNRILSGRIAFDNSGATPWFADPNPASNSAYADIKPSANFYCCVPSAPGGKVYVNNGIWFQHPVNSDALDRVDLLTVAMHEIGHGLGLLQAPPEYTSPFQFEITTAVSPRYAGLEIFLDSLGIFEHLPSPSLMMPRIQPGIRQFPAALDIMVIAQLSEYNNPTWYPSLELIVNGVDVPVGEKDSLLAKLRNSRMLLENGNRAAARLILRAFIQEVRANPGGGLTLDQMGALISIAKTAIAGIGA